MGFATQIPPCKGEPLTPWGFAPNPSKGAVPLYKPLLTLAARQRGKGGPCPFRGSVGLWSRVKVKPLRGRPDGANLDTSKRRDCNSK